MESTKALSESFAAVEKSKEVQEVGSRTTKEEGKKEEKEEEDD